MQSTARHGPTQSPIALLLIDVINPMDFAGAQALLETATPAARRIRSLAQRSRASGIPVIYVNDNFDCWHLGFHALVEELLAADVPGAPIIRLLVPEPATDFYILKPSHSGFFRTGLEVLLRRLGTHRLILSGFAGDICVLFTANDAYMRGFEVVVPADCLASERARDNAHALRHMQRLLKADIAASRALDLEALRAPDRTRKRAAIPAKPDARLFIPRAGRRGRVPLARPSSLVANLQDDAVTGARPGAVGSARRRATRTSNLPAALRRNGF
jgi:nicotinamidase-related amidase